VYDPRGERIGTYTVTTSGTYPYLSAYLVVAQTNVWFAGKLVNRYNAATFTQGAVYRDRLGSERGGGQRYYPYGDEITSTANDAEKFGTYFRDSFTTLDYADQRYYANAYGRFNTADPYHASAGPSDPGTWNRYSYTAGDPVNRNDRRGQDYVLCDGYEGDPDDPTGGCDDGGWGDGPSYSYNSGGDAFPNPNLTFRLDRANLIHAGGILLSRQSISPKCEGGLQALGADFDVLAVSASLVNIVNGTTDQQSVASAYGSASLGAAAQAYYNGKYSAYLQANGLQNLTVAGYFAATGNTAAWTPPGGGAVYINPNLLNTADPAADEGLMLHVMLHEDYGLDDTDIMMKLAQYDPKAGINPNGPSSQISVWMTKNCVNGKGNN